MQSSRAVRMAVAAGLALAMSGAASAQSTTIDFVNSGLEPIELLDGTAVTIDGNGNMQASCVLDGESCKGISGGAGGAGVPAVTLGSAKGQAPSVSTGEQLSLNWSSTNAPEVCVARGPASVASWTGTKAASGSQNVSFSSVGNYALSLECYNDLGSGTSAAVNVTVEQGTTPADSCDITSSHPNFQPSGFTPNVLTWAEAFYGQSFPSIKNGGLSPVGSFTFGHTSPGKSMRGQYIAVEFVAPAGGMHGIDWYRSQRIDSRNYKSNRPADYVYVTISPCMGDFRPPDYAAPNTDAASTVCRSYKQDGGISFGTASNGCRLQAGKKYYINIVFSDPFRPNGLDPSTDTCASGFSPYCNSIFGSLQ